MPRVERTDSITHPQELREAHRCRYRIRLEGREFVCLRSHLHDGIHDAYCMGPDGYLVRW